MFHFYCFFFFAVLCFVLFASRFKLCNVFLICSKNEGPKKAAEVAPVCPSSPKSGPEDDEVRKRRAEFFKKKGAGVPKK